MATDKLPICWVVWKVRSTTSEMRWTFTVSINWWIPVLLNLRPRHLIIIPLLRVPWKLLTAIPMCTTKVWWPTKRKWWYWALDLTELARGLNLITVVCTAYWQLPKLGMKPSWSTVTPRRFLLTLTRPTSFTLNPYSGSISTISSDTKNPKALLFSWVGKQP